MAKTAGDNWARKMKEQAREQLRKIDLYSVFAVGSDRQLYPGNGVPLGDAERLSYGLVAPSEVRLVRAATE